LGIFLSFYAEVGSFQARSWALEPKEGPHQRGGKAEYRQGGEKVAAPSLDVDAYYQGAWSL